MVSLAKRIHDLREDHDETQADIAKVLNVAKPRISEWERGVYTPGIDVLITLADHWNVNLDYLAGISDNPKRS